jgi:hypothetical protein
VEEASVVRPEDGDELVRCLGCGRVYSKADGHAECPDCGHPDWISPAIALENGPDRPPLGPSK